MMTNEKFATIKQKLLPTVLSQRQRGSMMCEQNRNTQGQTEKPWGTGVNGLKQCLCRHFNDTLD